MVASYLEHSQVLCILGYVLYKAHSTSSSWFFTFLGCFEPCGKMGHKYFNKSNEQPGNTYPWVAMSYIIFLSHLSLEHRYFKLFPFLEWLHFKSWCWCAWLVAVHWDRSQFGISYVKVGRVLPFVLKPFHIAWNIWLNPFFFFFWYG